MQRAGLVRIRCIYTTRASSRLSNQTILSLHGLQLVVPSTKVNDDSYADPEGT